MQRQLQQVAIPWENGAVKRLPLKQVGLPLCNSHTGHSVQSIHLALLAQSSVTSLASEAMALQGEGNPWA